MLSVKLLRLPTSYARVTGAASELDGSLYVSTGPVPLQAAVCQHASAVYLVDSSVSVAEYGEPGLTMLVYAWGGRVRLCAAEYDTRLAAERGFLVHRRVECDDGTVHELDVILELLGVDPGDPAESSAYRAVVYPLRALNGYVAVLVDVELKGAEGAARAPPAAASGLPLSYGPSLVIVRGSEVVAAAYLTPRSSSGPGGMLLLGGQVAAPPLAASESGWVVAPPIYSTPWLAAGNGWVKMGVAVMSTRDWRVLSLEAGQGVKWGDWSAVAADNTVEPPSYTALEFYHIVSPNVPALTPYEANIQAAWPPAARGAYLAWRGATVAVIDPHIGGPDETCLVVGDMTVACLGATSGDHGDPAVAVARLRAAYDTYKVSTEYTMVQATGAGSEVKLPA